MDRFEALVGKKIKAVYGGKGETYIGFLTDKGYIEYGCEGDCCSSSWFEHISGIEYLVGATVKETEEISLDSITDEDQVGHECLQSYGFQLITDKGYFSIDLRNSSNGYYGGWVTGPSASETCPHLKPVKEDF